MKIELNKISVKDVYKVYKDSQEDGVVAYDGKLNVRPAFQREFVYKDKQFSPYKTLIVVSISDSIGSLYFFSTYITFSYYFYYLFSLINLLYNNYLNRKEVRFSTNLHIKIPISICIELL